MACPTLRRHAGLTPKYGDLVKPVRFLDRITPYLWVLAVLLIVGGTALIFFPSALDALFDSRAADRAAAEAQVRAMYEAMNENNTDAFMDSILPSSRSRFSLDALRMLGEESIEEGSATWQVVAAGKLLNLTRRIDEFGAVPQADGSMLVKASGKLRYSAMGLEVDFCDLHEVRSEDGQWYVDFYAPEHEARVAAALARDLKGWDTGIVALDKVRVFAGSVFSGNGHGLNFCGDEAQ